MEVDVGGRLAAEPSEEYEAEKNGETADDEELEEGAVDEPKEMGGGREVDGSCTEVDCFGGGARINEGVRAKS